MFSYRKHFFDYVAQTSDAPMALEIKKAEGVYLKTTDGKKYIDLISGISVSNLGHRNKSVVQAVRKQIAKYWHTMVYGEYIQSPQVKLAELLTSHLPEKLNSVYFVNSGSEAIEGSLKLAKRVTGRGKFVAMKNAYHGSTAGALSLMSDEFFSNTYRPLVPGVSYIEYNNEEQLSEITCETAAVVVEIIQGEAGYIPGNHKYLNLLRKKCDEVGALLIADEIQTGMGRSGSLYAFEQTTIVPDILCTAKAFGGGMPLGAFVANKTLMDKFTYNPVLGHITTFGGHPVCCAAGYENLRQLTKSDLISDVERKSSLFRSLLKHPEIQEITGQGLMLGIQLESAERMHAVVDECIKNGVIIDWFLFAEDKLRVAPPLIISENEIHKACKVILNALDATKN